MNHIPDLTPRMDSTAKLLILLSRNSLTSAQRLLARSLAATIEDWSDVVALAEHKYVATYVYKHLKDCAADLVPPNAITALRSLARQTGLAVLLMTSSLARFHTQCIQPTGTSHAYIKGIALSAQFSWPITERFCRDIDVLIDSKAFHRVLAAALDAGYRALISTDPVRFTNDPVDLKFLARYADVVTLIDCDGVGIEVHRQLDKLSLDFDVTRALRDAETVQVAGLPIRTLNKPLHFVYASYHHSRHFWSRLHWLADLDGMVASVNRAEALKVAASIGIEPAIAAAFDLWELTCNPDAWTANQMMSTHSGQYLSACLVNLRGGLEVEEALREDMTLSDFMADWQISPGRYNTMWLKSWRHRLRPSVTQYNHHRYPAPLYWIYSIENALSLGRNAFSLAAGAALRLGRSRSV
jgi:hypothetical protein